MRLVQGSDQSVEVQWFFTDPVALPGPYTRLASGNWSSDPVWPWVGVGEVKGAPRRWVNGENPYGQTGLTRCGTDDELTYGLQAWPNPGEWHWCCTPYVSHCVVGVQDPPHGSEPGPFLGESPPIPAVAFLSTVVVTASGASFAAPIAIVGSSPAAPPAPPAPPQPIVKRYHSRLAVMILPRTVAPFSSLSSSGGALAALINPPGSPASLHRSDLVVTVSAPLPVNLPSVSSSPAAPISGYSLTQVSATSGGFVSALRVTVEPEGFVNLPSISGGSSLALAAGSPATFSQYISSLCVCCKPITIGGGGLPPLPPFPLPIPFVGYTAAKTGVAYSSAVCVCVSAEAQEVFSPATYYGSSGVAPGVGPPLYPDVPCVPTSCFACVPTTLYATFTGSLARYGTVVLTWVVGSEWESVSLPPCGGGTGPTPIVLSCFGDVWVMAAPGIIESWVFVSQISGNPFLLRSTGTGNSAGCPGAFAVTVFSLP